MPTEQQLQYRRFKVLLDEPAPEPGLSFDDYAQAFADIIRESTPQFAIGIFGAWGSGKTTLMHAIKSALAVPPAAPTGAPVRTAPQAARTWRQRLRSAPRSPVEATPQSPVIPVWFNAWRYEREDHLIIPLLDTLREGLATWAEQSTPGSTERSQAKAAAATVGRAARALAAGLSVRASLPSVDLQIDPKDMMDAWKDSEKVANDPLSFYHATFGQMQAAIKGVTTESDRRVVIFIDDLDRCLPLNALEVLESMKLFFDLQGFVFVVGLDQAVIERAIEMKYQPSETAKSDGPAFAEAVGRILDARDARQAPGQSAQADIPSRARRAASISGTEYVKKLFQVPFTLPRINVADLPQFFETLVATNNLPTEQQQDLRAVMGKHLEAATGGDAATVNPREVKRLVNAYSLQMKMLSAKLPEPPIADIVVALQVMGFRTDWRDLYDLLVAEPDLFTSAVRDVIDDVGGQIVFSLRPEPLPRSYVDYVRGPASSLLLPGVSLEPYITSAESVGSTNPSLAEARTIISRLKRLIEPMTLEASLPAPNTYEEISAKVSSLYEAVDRSASDPTYGSNAFQLAAQLQSEVRVMGDPTKVAEGTAPWIRIASLLDQLDDRLRQVQRQTSLASAS